MNRGLKKQFDVLVVGGGPAGMAAAVCAAESGRRVGIVDRRRQSGRSDRMGLGLRCLEEQESFISLNQEFCRQKQQRIFTN